jgi:hypothetical protein
MALLNYNISDILKENYENLEFISSNHNIYKNKNKNKILSKKINFSIFKKTIKFIKDTSSKNDGIHISSLLRVVFRNYDILTKKGFVKIYNFILYMYCWNQQVFREFSESNNCKNCIYQLIFLFSKIKNVHDRLFIFTERSIGIPLFHNCLIIFARNCNYWSIVRRSLRELYQFVNLRKHTIELGLVYHEICSNSNLKTIKTYHEIFKKYLKKYNIDISLSHMDIDIIYDKHNLSIIKYVIKNNTTNIFDIGYTIIYLFANSKRITQKKLIKYLKISLINLDQANFIPTLNYIFNNCDKYNNNIIRIIRIIYWFLEIHDFINNVLKLRQDVNMVTIISIIKPKKLNIIKNEMQNAKCKMIPKLLEIKCPVIIIEWLTKNNFIVN